jgi:hypothetical protein
MQREPGPPIEWPAKSGTREMVAGAACEDPDHALITASRILTRAGLLEDSAM